MKIKDILISKKGINQIKARHKKKVKKSDATINTNNDNIMELSKFINPGRIEFIVSSKTYLSDTLVCVRLTSKSSIPPFVPSQYVSLEFEIGGIKTTRPYSITSSLAHIFSDNQYIEIIVRKSEAGFVSKYIYDELAVGEKLFGSMPHGDTCYNPLRDSKNIVMIASGRGITTILAMARSIKDQIYDCNLTIVYTARTFEDYICYDELKEYNTYFLLTDEPHEGIKMGLIDKKFLENISNDDTTYFVFGSNELNQVVRKELLKINVEERRIRCSIDVNRDYTVSKIERYYIKAIKGDETIEIVAKNNETILESLEAAGISIRSICRRGKCGACIFKLIEGKVYSKQNDNRRSSEIEYHYYHACSTYPLSNLTIRLHHSIK